MIKSFIIGVTLGCMLGVPSTYSTTAQVVCVDYHSNTFSIQTECGHVYRMYGVEDWMLGDNIRCRMDSLGTITLEDDIPVEMIYAGNSIAEYVENYKRNA